MDMRWLQDFIVLAEIGNFTHAASQRNLSQAAFSRRIMALEAWAGSKLVNRSTVPIRLTEAGERFLDRAQDISQIISNVRHEPLQSLNTRAEDMIRIAAPLAIAMTHLPRWMERWNSSGELRANVSSDWVHEGFSALAVGDLDIVICYHMAAQPLQASHDRFESVTIGKDRMIPVVGSGIMKERGWSFPGTLKRPIPILMYQHRTYLGRVVDLILAQAPNAVIGTPIIAAQMASILAPLAVNGMGVAWVPDPFLDLHQGQLEALWQSGPWTAEMSIVAYRNRTPSRYAVRRVWEQICELETTPR